MLQNQLYPLYYPRHSKFGMKKGREIQIHKQIFAVVFLSSELFCRVAAKEKFFKPNLQLFKVSHSLSEVHYRPGHLAQNLTFSMDGLKGTSMDFAEEEPETEVTECFREKLTPYVLLFFTHWKVCYNPHVTGT